MKKQRLVALSGLGILVFVFAYALLTLQNVEGFGEVGRLWQLLITWVSYTVILSNAPKRLRYFLEAFHLPWIGAGVLLYLQHTRGFYLTLAIACVIAIIDGAVAFGSIGRSDPKQGKARESDAS